MNLKNTLAAIAMFLYISLGMAFGQAQQPQSGVSGQVYTASAYGSYTSSIYKGNTTTGSTAIVAAPVVVFLSNGEQIIPFVANTPITVDRGAANSETVTPTLANCYPNSITCTLSASYLFTHIAGETLQSGSFGVQEAVNAAMKAGAGTVLIDSTYQGPAGTAIILAATGSTSVVIQDNRSGTPVYYQWNGSAYALVASASGTVSSGTGACLAWYPSTGTTVSSDCNFTDTTTNLLSLLPIQVNDGNAFPAIVLGVGGATGPNITAAAGVPTGCGSTFPVGSHDSNSTGGPGTVGYDCSGAALAVNSGAFNQGLLATSNAFGGTLITNTTFNNAFTLATAATVNSCSFYLGHYTNAAHHIACGIVTAPTATTTGTTVLCFATYTEVNGPFNATVTVPLTGCGTLTAGNYWMFLTTDDSGFVSAGQTNCGSACTPASYEGTSTWTFGGTPVITTSALTVVGGSLQYLQSLNVTPSGTPWLGDAPVGVDISANGQVVGLQGVALSSLGAGPLGLDTNGIPRIMPVSDYPLTVSGAFGNNTNFPTGRQVAAVTAINAGIITGINIVNTSINAGTCTTGPTFNVFTASISNIGTPLLASASVQATVGTITHSAQNLQFGAGQVIGIYVSTAGATCLANTFTVTMQYTEQ